MEYVEERPEATKQTPLVKKHIPLKLKSSNNLTSGSLSSVSSSSPTLTNNENTVNTSTTNKLTSNITNSPNKQETLGTGNFSFFLHFRHLNVTHCFSHEQSTVEYSFILLKLSAYLKWGLFMFLCVSSSDTQSQCLCVFKEFIVKIQKEKGL